MDQLKLDANRTTNSAADPRDSFRMTEIGELPADWRVVKLGDVFQLQQGKALSPKHRRGKSPRHFLRTSNVLWGRIDLTKLDEMDFSDDEMDRLSLIPGDLLVCEGGEIGRTAIWRGERSDCSYQNHLHRLRVRDRDALPEFYALWMRAALCLLNLYVGAGNTTTIANLSKSRLAALVVPLPPLPEQRAIARMLRTVQAAIEATERVIAAAEELKRSMMEYLFTYGSVPVDQAEQVELVDSEIGRTPASWTQSAVGECFEVQLGKMLSQKARRGVSPKPYLRNANVQWGRIDLSDLLEMDFDDRETEKFRLRAGDILVCEGGQVGRTALWEEQLPECYYQKAIHRLRPTDDTQVPRFFMYYMMMLLQVRHVPIVEGARSTIAHLPMVKLKALPYYHPAGDEQRCITRLLMTVDEELDSRSRARESAKALFDSLLHNLMTGRIRVTPTEQDMEAGA